MKADIKLLAVTPSMPPVYVGEGFIPTDTLDAEKERFREVLEDGIRQLEAQGFVCQGQLSFGEPVDEIARVAREWTADLIVMGHRRAGVVGRTLVARVAQPVAGRDRAVQRADRGDQPDAARGGTLGGLLQQRLLLEPLRFELFDVADQVGLVDQQLLQPSRDRASS